MSTKNRDKERRVQARQESLIAELQRYQELPQEERERLERAACASLGFDPEDIIKMVVSIGAMAEDPTAVAAVCSAASKRLFDTAWERALYSNIMSSPTVLVSVITQAAVGGFLVGSGRAPQFDPETLEVAGEQSHEGAQGARMCWVDVLTRGLRDLILARATEIDDIPRNWVN